jgi:hypothetical protein
MKRQVMTPDAPGVLRPLAMLRRRQLARNEAGRQGGAEANGRIIVEGTKFRECGRGILKNEALSVLLHARLFV